MIRNLNQVTFQGFGTVPPERSHSTGGFDKQDPAKRDFDSADLAPYLSPGNTITVKYVYENNSEYNWDVLLPVLNVMGRTIDDRD